MQLRLIGDITRKPQLPHAIDDLVALEHLDKRVLERFGPSQRLLRRDVDEGLPRLELSVANT